jgi:hypothetical protein
MKRGEAGARALNAKLSPEERSERARKAALAGAAKRRAAKEAAAIEEAKLAAPRARIAQHWSLPLGDLEFCPVCRQMVPVVVSGGGYRVLAWHYPVSRQDGYAPQMADGGCCRGTPNDGVTWGMTRRANSYR